jgi:phage tail-like protein
MSEIIPVERQGGSVSLAVDQYTRYPSEPITIFARFSPPLEGGAVFQLTIPQVIEVSEIDGPGALEKVSPAVIVDNNQRILLFQLDEDYRPGESYDLSLVGRIHTFYFDHFLDLEARLLSARGDVLASETVQVAIRRGAGYLQYLPELYESDDFINRFLMMFESFWKPISQQIDQGEAYYDSGIAPPAFVPWLSSWIGLPVDENLPVERIRALLGSAMLFYQRRGTIQALKTYLEIYTAGEVSIVEKRSRNFVLGLGSRMGFETALGTANHPNMVTVRVCVPQGELERMRFTPSMYQQKLYEIVRQMVPAHTVIEVQCDFQEAVALPEMQRI